ncbi:hypothetical protein VTJ83DRAFT_2661 [Remersonia thermophila]|uniref:Phosphatidate phosphatase APP1 catalytic domain-containing protein n=1 Tax=Remersonia thermophila TaxID=72144 RepID=A0ABR4DJK7_9PEZI
MQQGYSSSDSSDGYGARYGRYGDASPGPERERERGARRKKLAVLAGNVYRAGVAAASEIREQYNNSRAAAMAARSMDPSAAGGGGSGGSGGVSQTVVADIPSSFPHVSIITHGEEQLVLFPTYAKRHVREPVPPWFRSAVGGGGAADPGASGMSEEEFWKRQWTQAEDEKAVVDVDVRGWLYTPHRGPMTRRNRMVIGLARRLSGIPAPAATAGAAAAGGGGGMADEEEQRRIAREAREIEARGQMEEDVASRGGYSEPPGGGRNSNSNHLRTEPSPPPPRRTTMSSSTLAPADMTDAELAVANANLMARIGPFMTTPLVQTPVSLFFYNDTQSRSYTVTTDDAGHFYTRVALEFVPTEMRILATEYLSTTQPVQVIDPRGVSLISDVDDTVKQSNILLGTREIFRTVFVRDLADQTVDGVREWYGRMRDLGVEMHYCSNSPWQLFPLLASFFHIAGLPRGSMHLKRYTGMLQGIFEPVAERKKGTLDTILRDFPERKFLLVGDSGEADLEVYTELALANPGRILAVFIRDVTTPEQPAFFDPWLSIDGGGAPARERPQEPKRPRPLPPRSPAPSLAPSTSSGPVMGTLIDLSDPEPAPAGPAPSQRGPKPSSPSSSNAPGSGPAPAKPRQASPLPPAKPASLRSKPTDSGSPSAASSLAGNTNLPRSAAVEPQTLPLRPLNKPAPPPPPPPRRSGTSGSLAQGQPTTQQQQQQQQQQPPQPAAAAAAAAAQRATAAHPRPPPLMTVTPPPGGKANALPRREPFPAPAPSMPGSYPPSPASAADAAAVNKKVDLWLRRLARARELLDAQGVRLHTWRRGDDVADEAERIVREALRGMGVSVPGGKRGTGR